MNKRIAKTPPMGWNSWDCYGASVKEETVRANADYMAKHLKKYGWEYIVVDIQWSEPTAENHEYHKYAELHMDAYGRLMPAPERFPSASDGKGFTALADYVHSLGLKFGIHIMRGIPRQAVHANVKIKGSDLTARQITNTDYVCKWNTDMYSLEPSCAGAQAYVDSLFELYASWGVDFVKVDDIANKCGVYTEAEVEMIEKAIEKCGRDMVLSLSPGPALPEKAEHLKQHANMWRITDDFWDNWDQLYDMFSRAETWCIHAGQGHWPDADMLPVGAILQDYDKNNRTRFTKDEQYTMLTLWCMMRSPLMIGGDMIYNDAFTLELLTNSEILEMLSQARNSRPLFRKTINGCEIILWQAYRKDGGMYYAVFNAGETDCSLCLDAYDLQMDCETFSYRELWTGVQTDNANELICTIRPHGAVALFID